MTGGRWPRELRGEGFRAARAGGGCGRLRDRRRHDAYAGHLWEGSLPSITRPPQGARVLAVQLALALSRRQISERVTHMRRANALRARSSRSATAISSTRCPHTLRVIVIPRDLTAVTDGLGFGGGLRGRLSVPGGGAEHVWDRRLDARGREHDPLAGIDGKAGALDRCSGVARGVAAARDAWP
jgi:hypothetical protein